MDKKKMIKLIEMQPSLYNSELPSYRFQSTQLKSLYWKRICRTLKCQPKDIISSWKYLKLHYTRQLIRKTKDTSFSKKWKYEDDISSFMFPIIEKRIKSNYEDFWNKYGNDEINNELNDDECDDQNEINTTDNKLLYETLSNTNDANEYLTSITNIISQWPEDEQIKFTNEISKSLAEAETEVNSNADNLTKIINGVINCDDDDVIFVEKQDEVINIDSDDDNAIANSNDKENNHIIEQNIDKNTGILTQIYPEPEIVSEILPDEDSDNITVSADECSIEYLPDTSEIDIQENSIKDELLSESNKEEILPD